MYWYVDIQRAKLNIRKSAFHISVAKQEKNLPESIVQAKSINLFKNCLD